MDLAATSAGPWLVLGIVVGALLSGLLGLALARLRPGSRPGATDVREPSPPDPEPVDDLPGFLEHPPGTAGAGPPAPAAEVRLGSGPALLDPPERPTRPTVVPAARSDPPGGRLLVGLTTAAALLVGAAAAVAAVTPATERTRGTASAAAPAEPADTEEPAAEPTGPSWPAPDLSVVPSQPSPGGPGAGRLATASVPVGPEGALARAAFEGLVLERRAVGVTVTYPTVSITAAAVPGGPALAHVRLPVWNCLGEAAPPDPDEAGCRRLPDLHADLGTPALSVSTDGTGLRIEGRFPTYVRPTGSPPRWTGEVYPLAVTWSSGRSTVHLGSERAPAVDDPRLTELRLGR